MTSKSQTRVSCKIYVFKIIKTFLFVYVGCNLYLFINFTIEYQIIPIMCAFRRTLIMLRMSYNAPKVINSAIILKIK